MAHGKLQLAMPIDKVKEISKLSLMVCFVSNLDLKKFILINYLYVSITVSYL